LRIGGFKNDIFLNPPNPKSQILNPKFFFFHHHSNQSDSYGVPGMGLNFDDYLGFQPKATPA
jgi:hypothetical protein